MWRRLAAIAVVGAFVGAPLTAFAQLDSLGPVNQNGTGFGSVNTILAVQAHGNATTEAGCIGPAISTCLPGDMVPGAPHSGLYTVGQIPGISGSNLRLFLDFAEPGNGTNGAVLNNTTLTLYNGTSALFSSSLSSPITFSTTFQGIGNTGFAFGLSPSDAALFDTFLAQQGSASYTLGLSTALSGVHGGPETWYIGTANTTVPPTTTTPEPGSLALLGTGLFGLVPMVRRKLQK